MNVSPIIDYILISLPLKNGDKINIIYFHKAKKF